MSAIFQSRNVTFLSFFHPSIHQALTYYNCVVSDLLRIPPVVVKGHVPDSRVQVLNEARLVHVHRARVSSSCREVIVVRVSEPQVCLA